MNYNVDMNLAQKIRYRLFPVDPDVVAAYQTVLPKEISLSFTKDGDYLIAKVERIEGDTVSGSLLTEAKTFEELVSNVNDLIYTKFNMPEYVRPYYGDIFAPHGYKKHAKSVVLKRA